MTDKSSLIAERLGRRIDTAESAEELDDLGCYALLRGIRDRCPMIDFLVPSGDCFAFSYADLTRVILRRNRQLELAFGSVVVTLHGEQFREASRGVGLHAGLKLHRVPWVKAVDPLKSPVTAEVAMVTKIDIEDSLGRIKS